MRAFVMRAAIFALCAITVVCNSFADVDLYVSTSGTDENDGLSPETPKLTLESAIIAATNGLARKARGIREMGKTGLKWDLGGI